MKGDSFKLVKTLFHLTTEYLGVLGVFITIHLFFQDKVDMKNIVTIEKIVFIALCIVWAIALLSNLVKSIKVHLSEKKRYTREFLRKSKIGYEVGSFWDVVKRFQKEDDLAIILGVNNRYKIDGDYLNHRSLVHDFVSQFDDETVEKVRGDIMKKLDQQIVAQDEDGHPVFEYGSIFVVPPMNGIKYETGLLSMCEPSKSNISQRFVSERRVLMQSFEKMFEEMPGIFTNATIIIPLIGTSSSGSHLSHEEVAKYLISAFADYSRINNGRLAKQFILSIYDKDIKQKFINLEEIKRHIDNECDSRDFSYSTLKYQLKAQ